MRIDRPGDDDTPTAATSPSEFGAKRSADNSIDAPGVAPEPTEVEGDLGDSADRASYYARYQEAVDAVYLAAARERWDGAKPKLEAEWLQHAKQNPAPPDVTPNIDGDVAAHVERGCEGIRRIEEKNITPAMERIQAEDPERQLVGLEHRCKGQDRIMEKVAAALEEQPGLTPAEALASVKDAIRYTFQYTEEHYTEGVNADIERLKLEGFEPVDVRNSWGSEEYKGINSRWRVPENGQLFEVQFHTQISFEAKQLTHEAYERLRNPSTSKAEQDELVDFQRRANAFVPDPRRVRDIPNYP